MVAALLAQEGLTVFCIYLLIFHLFFFKKRMFSWSPGSSFWNACMQQSVGEGSPFALGEADVSTGSWSAASGGPACPLLPAVGLSRVGGLLVALPWS